MRAEGIIGSIRTLRTIGDVMDKEKRDIIPHNRRRILRIKLRKKDKENTRMKDARTGHERERKIPLLYGRERGKRV